ncbi:hypothetical protein GWI33_016123 [Rhynchophorus ferrugineus]|uniref:Uncharacterized protein n=1 Tax=Rhynchophorus ferrugineus TaxID=354439 RepID=A0A834M905_RHYFE|nr:hypothetical protein GWI33_016123 [Rhynchophorus ferrugineus]
MATIVAKITSSAPYLFINNWKVFIFVFFAASELDAEPFCGGDGYSFTGLVVLVETVRNQACVDDNVIHRLSHWSSFIESIIRMKR